ncbi:Sphingosine-1-phosphate lyase [Diplonema papillatum]|nr:Sphingosine-1-phosphate lyase [Diplonema papillatum]
MGDPLVSVVAFTSKEFDIYRLLLQMEKKGWELNSLQFPPALHLCVTMLHAKNDMEHAKRFVDDLTMETAKLLETKDEKATGMAALYGTTQSIPDRSAIGDVAKLYFDAYYDAADPGEVYDTPLPVSNLLKCQACLLQVGWRKTRNAGWRS